MNKKIDVSPTSSSDTTEVSRRRIFTSALVAIGGVFAGHQALAGTWRKVLDTTNALMPPSGTSILKANNGGQLVPATPGTDYAAPGTATSFTAEQTFKAVKETVYNLVGTVISPSNGTIQYKTLTANTTFTESLSSGHAITLMIDDGANYTVTWPTMNWVGGSAPVLATTGYSVIVLWKVQTTLYGAYIGNA